MREVFPHRGLIQKLLIGEFMSHTLARSNDRLSATCIYNNLVLESKQIEEPGEVYEVAQTTFDVMDKPSHNVLNKPMSKKSPENDLIYAQFQNLLTNLKAATPDVQLAVKSLCKKELQSINPELPLEVSQYKVKPKIEEADFNKLYQDTDNLISSTKNLRERAITRIKLISGAATSLNKNDPEYNAKKEEALTYFSGYESLYNQSIDKLSKLNAKEEEINQLQRLTNETIDQFISENNLRIEHFRSQFKILYSEHGYVDERIKTGYESTKSHILGVTSNVILPAKKNETDLTQSQLDLSNDFSPFFVEINEYYSKLKNFADRVQAHLNNVAGTRKAWNEQHPDFADFKESASFLPKKYEPLSDECGKVYKKLDEHNEKLEKLKEVLTRKLSDKSNEILASKNLHIETFATYVSESKKLDMAIHGSLTICKDIRILNVNTKEKYPTKEKEDQKEVKEVLL